MFRMPVKIFKKEKIFYKILLPFLTIFFVLLFSFLISLNKFVKKKTFLITQKETLNRLAMAKLFLDVKKDKIISEMDHLSKILAPILLDESQLPLIKSILSSFEAVTDKYFINIFDKNGEMIKDAVYSKKDDLYQVPDIKADTVLYGLKKIFIIPCSNDAIIDAIIPIKHDNEIIGYIHSHHQLKNGLCKSLAKHLNNEVYLFEKDKILDSSYLQKDPEELKLPHEIIQTICIEKKEIVRRVCMAKKKYTAGFLPLENMENQISSFLMIPIDNSLARKISSGIIFRGFLYGIGGIIILAFTGFLIAKGISKPLLDIVKVSQRVGSGDLNVNINADTNDEIADLGRAFNKMIKDMKETTVSKNYVDDIISCMNDTLIVFDIDSLTIKTVNNSICKLLGYEEIELIGKPVSMIFEEADLVVKAKCIEELMERGIHNFELRYKTKAGHLIPSLCSATVLKDKTGKTEGIVCVGKDISERKQMEEMLRDSEKRLKIIFDSVQTGIFIVDKNTFTIVDANPVAVKTIGFPKEKIIGSKCYNYLYPNDPGKCPIAALGKDTDCSECNLLKADGQSIPILKSVTRVMLKGQEYLIENFIDLSERKKAEKDIYAEKERLTVTLRSIGDGVIATNIKGEILLLNKVAEDLTGYTNEEAIGKPVNKIFNIINEQTGKELNNPVWNVLKSGERIELENSVSLVSRGGSLRNIANSAAPIRDKDGNMIGVVLVFRDVTQKQKLDKEIRKIHKLESIGVLAGGIAHDFNNILTAILGNISLAKLSLNPKDKIFNILNDAEMASLRAKDLTGQLLTFSKGGAPIRKKTIISELIRNTVQLILSGTNIRCNFFFSADLWPANIDEGQIKQVIVNLVTNAREAMPEGGIINISAENIVLDTKNKRLGIPIQDGRYIRILVQDHGVGMSQEYLSVIFDPYFSTKDRGTQKGMGLGLSIAHSIIKKHDGYIYAESEVGVGTTIFIYLPASFDQTPQNEEKQKDVKESFMGRGKVLIMDDEEVVRNVVGIMLKEIGYEADFAQDVAEAVRLYKQAKDKGVPFDAVILDLTIQGGIGGKEAIKILLEIDSNVKAILSSGYYNDPILSNYKAYGFCGVIAKPYNIKELGKILYKVIRG